MAKICNFTPDEYINYQEDLKMIYDYENTIDYAEKKGWKGGREKGLEEGREEGKEERSIEIARSLVGIGMPTGQIAAITKLTEEQVKAFLWQCPEFCVNAK